MAGVYDLNKVNNTRSNVIEPPMEEVQNTITEILSNIPEDLRERPVEIELTERSIYCDAKTLQVHVQPGRASIRFLPLTTRGDQ